MILLHFINTMDSKIFGKSDFLFSIATINPTNMFRKVGYHRLYGARFLF